ncbi:MAG: TonB-dependent receptor [Alphaproteobacteria bacterium]|nr:TonB-dependent receptor [Alphaproteobacteria bacterium]MBL7097131.1 TonB-dependent receptor [Alphaproteobacteria bacterium]
MSNTKTILRPRVALATLLLTSALTVPAFAEIEVVVVTAQKRAEDVQTIPVAISVFTSEKRDLIGITSVQDMTNFTPGLAYQTSLDRVFLRGVGRQTNSQAADTPVANYDDGLFETFAVAAGRSSLDLDRVEVLRGPQGTLSGRNALGGALNEITVHPSTDAFHGEARIAYGAYNHVTPEISLTGPLDDIFAFRVYALWDKQTQGYSKNIVPNAQQAVRDPLYTGRPQASATATPNFGNAGDGNVIDEWYVDGQIQAKFNEHFEMWTKIQSAQWWNGAGGPGADLEGWTPADYPTYEVAQGGLYNNAGYGCTALPGSPYLTANTTIVAGSVVTPLSGAQACVNPGRTNPWTQARLIQTGVRLPSYFSLNTQWTWHADGFDVKYIGGGSYYRYHLASELDVHQAPITSYRLGAGSPGCPAAGCTIDNRWTYNPEEENSFISNEINLISTGEGPFQWVAGAYQFSQQANQPGDAFNPNQPQVNGPFTDGPFFPPGFFCSSPLILGGNGTGTGGVCAPSQTYRSFESRNNIHDHSYAIFGQVDYKILDELKLTAGLRYSWDRKFGSESARVICYFGFCDAFGIGPDTVGGLFAKAADTTQTGIVVSSGVPTPPQGVTGPTTYDPNTGFATRRLNAQFSGWTGTFGAEWTPMDGALFYAKYGRGYKDGGYYEGANTALTSRPFTQPEFVNSFEVGAKYTWDSWLTTNVALFHYDYKNLQLPLAFANQIGVVQLNSTAFYNVPRSISQGAELEVTAQPIDDLAITFNYSYNDAHVTKGTAIDLADPEGLAAGGQPLYTEAQCKALLTPAGGPCSGDAYSFPTTGAANGYPAAAATGGTLINTGWYIPQNLKGNQLPNAARNKIAFNIMYNWHTDLGVFTPSLSYVWRDKQYGTLFQRSYNQAPSWDQVDLRVRWASDDDRYEVIMYGKNITNNIIYDTGAIGTRYAGTVHTPCVGGGVPTFFGAYCNMVQGVNGPTGYGPVFGEDSGGRVKTYQVGPPALWGIEFHYKFD